MVRHTSKEVEQNYAVDRKNYSQQRQELTSKLENEFISQKEHLLVSIVTSVYEDIRALQK